MFNKHYSLGLSPASLQTLGTHLHGWAQLGFLCSRGEAGLVPKWSSTLWASRPKPRTLAAGVPLISLGTSRTFYQHSSGPHSCPATILETQGGVETLPSRPRAPSSTVLPTPPGGAAPTKQGRRQQWRDQRAEEGRALDAAALQGQGPARRLLLGLPGLKPFPGCLHVCLANCAEQGKLNIVLASPPTGSPHRARECHLVAHSRLLGGMKASPGKGVIKMAASGNLVWTEGEGVSCPHAAAHASCWLSRHATEVAPQESPGRP